MASFGMESSMNFSKINHKQNDSKYFSNSSQSEVIREVVDHVPFKSQDRFIQPPDEVEYINTIESNHEETHRPLEEKENERKPKEQVKAPERVFSKPEFLNPNKMSKTAPALTESQTTSEIGPMPYLYVDVNITDNEMSTIEVFEGDQAEVLAKDFATKHGLDEKTEKKLVDMLKAQMATVL